MTAIAGPRPRQYLVAASVLLLHGAALWVLVRMQPQLREPAGDAVASVWLMVNPVIPQAMEDPADQKVAAAVRSAPSRANPEVPEEAAAISVAPVGAPTIRWDRASEEFVRGHADRLQAAKPRQFGQVEPSRPFKVCRRAKNSWEWKAEPGKAGLAGGLIPFVRLGKRCAIGLGFFGCSLDEPPPANGQLLDSMNDPDLPTSSVPSEADCLPD